MTTNIIIPSDPATKQKIKNACVEISNSMTRIDSERENIKEIVEMISEDTELPKKFVKAIGTTYHKQNFVEKTTDASDFETLYENIFELANGQA